MKLVLVCCLALVALAAARPEPVQKDKLTKTIEMLKNSNLPRGIVDQRIAKLEGKTAKMTKEEMLQLKKTEMMSLNKKGVPSIKITGEEPLEDVRLQLVQQAKAMRDAGATPEEVTAFVKEQKHVIKADMKAKRAMAKKNNRSQA